jgi:hypothetical protein
MSSVLRAFLAIFTSVRIEVHQMVKAFPTTIQRKVMNTLKEIRDLVSKMTFGDLEDMSFIFPAHVVESNNFHNSSTLTLFPCFSFQSTLIRTLILELKSCFYLKLQEEKILRKLSVFTKQISRSS